jgi:hypothetical protein
MRIHNNMSFAPRSFALLTGVALLFVLSSGYPQTVRELASENAQKKTSSNVEQARALVGTWRSYGEQINANNDFHELVDYSGHYRAEVKGDELLLTWIADKDWTYGVKGDERVAFYLKFDGRKLTGRKNWDGWPKTWGHVSEDGKEMWIYSEDSDNMLTRLLRREK